MSFKVSGLFDPNFDLVNVWPDLTNENLFDKEKCRVRGKGGYYEATETALRLASRIYSPTQLTTRHSSRDQRFLALSGNKTSLLHHPVRY